jgi:glutamate-1-semialdehyde 2,1-aminomutase
MHPKHNMFLSLAHTEVDIDAALSVTDEAFKIVAGL